MNGLPMSMKKHLRHWNNGSDKFWEIEVTGSSYIAVYGHTGTVGQVSIEVFNNEGECLKAAGELVEEQKQKGFTESEDGFIKRYELPAGLKQALQEPRIVKTAQGDFTLFAAHEIKVISVVVDHHRLPDSCEQLLPMENPYHDDNGLFCATAYSLVSKSPDSRDPEGILVWLPLLELFGTWDPDQYQLHLFRDVTWQHIEKELPHYLEAGRPASQNVLCLLKVWEYFDFIPADFSSRIDSILLHSDPARRKKVEEYIGQYEHRLLRHPFCVPLEDAFKSLIKAYHFLGQSFEEEARYSKAVEWFERSLLIIGQSHRFRNKVYADIFLQLSFCFLEMSMFDLSLYYINLFQSYDPTVAEACEQIKNSIHRIKQLYHNAMESYRMAVEAGSADHYEEAIRVTHQALEVAPNDPVLHFNLACFYSATNQVREALHYLEQALKRGFKDRQKLLTDEDLENIRSTREFEEILVKYLRT
jgi:predicted DNA-binding WGR domain protein